MRALISQQREVKSSTLSAKAYNNTQSSLLALDENRQFISTSRTQIVNYERPSAKFVEQPGNENIVRTINYLNAWLVLH